MIEITPNAAAAVRAVLSQHQAAPFVRVYIAGMG